MIKSRNTKTEVIYLKIRKSILRNLLSFTRTYTKEDLSGVRPGHILVIKLDRIGDMVMATPIFRALKEKWPDTKISVLANPVNESVIINNPFVDSIITYDKDGRHKCPLKKLFFLRTISKAGFDLLIDPYLDYELHTAIIARLVGSRYRLGFEFAGKEVFYNIRCPSNVFPFFTEIRHVIDCYLGLIACLGVDSKAKQPEVFLASAEKEKARKLLNDNGLSRERKIIGIHPGGHYESQRWPVERFAAVSDKLIKEYHAGVILFGGPGERRLISEFNNHVREAPIIFEKLSTREFMSVLSCCDLFLCNNSGPLHLATALDIPTVSTMGPTIPFHWWPRGEGHVVLRRDIDCSPCKKGICATHECMRMITVNDFMEAVREQIKNLDKQA